MYLLLEAIIEARSAGKHVLFVLSGAGPSERSFLTFIQRKERSRNCAPCESEAYFLGFTFSTTVVDGLRFAVDFLTKRPDLAERALVAILCASPLSRYCFGVLGLHSSGTQPVQHP